MKKRLAFLTVLSAVLLALAGCSRQNGVTTLRVIATTDVHGRFFDTDLLDGTERKGSLARLSAYLKQQRSEYRNVIYLDAGDILQGTIEDYQDITAQFDRSSLAARAYNLLGCQAIAFGNHDFAVGAPSFERFDKTSEFPLLGANVYFDEYGDYLPPFRILDFKGLKVAILGLSTPIVNYSIPADRMGGLEVKDVVKTAEFFVPYLRKQEKADVVIGLVHSGMDNGRMDSEGVYENAVRSLVAQVDGFDLIIYGHDHEAECTRLVSARGDSVLVINPGPYAMNAAAVTLSVDRSNPERVTVSTSGSIEDITSQVPDPQFMKGLSGWYDDVYQYADSVIGTLPAPLEGNGLLWRRSSYLDYIHGIQMGFNAAEISLTSPVFTVPYIPQGDVRIKDVLGMYRFDNTMVSVMLRGNEIRDVLEYSADYFYNTVQKDKQGGLLRLGAANGRGERSPLYSMRFLVTAAGVSYTVDVTQPKGKRVCMVSMADGTPFDPDKLYRTTVNSFLYGGDESALLVATGITRKEMRKRLITSGAADIRFYMLTELALKHEAGNSVRIRPVSNWKLIPENVVNSCLSVDTVSFSIIPND